MTHERHRHPLDHSPPRLSDMKPGPERDAELRIRHESATAAWLAAREPKRRPILSLFGSVR